MASSLDEIQPYDLFQSELEKALAEYLKKVDQKPFTKFIVNVFIEFVSFNKFIEKKEQLDNLIICEFEEWLPDYNPEMDIKQAVIKVKDFITFFNSRSLRV